MCFSRASLPIVHDYVGFVLLPDVLSEQVSKATAMSVMLCCVFGGVLLRRQQAMVWTI